MTVPTVVAVPYATLVNAKIIVTSIKRPYVAVDEHFLRFCMRPIISQIKIDEAWYLTQYPDVADASDQEGKLSAAEHYIKHGYYENRLPYEIKVDEAWYLEHYPDVATAVNDGVFTSAQAHFEQIGFAEGRLPFPNFSLMTLPVADHRELPKKLNGAGRRRRQASRTARAPVAPDTAAAVGEKP
jgi:hypothetical protein